MRGKDFVVAWGLVQYAPEGSAGIPRSWWTHRKSAEEGGRRQSRPIHGEISASSFQADWTGPRAMDPLGIYGELFLLRR
jgi:hypothetical protein